jgi:hypothetical protein
MDSGITGQLFHAAEIVPVGTGIGVAVLVGTGVIGETVRGLDVALGSGVVTGISKKLEVGDCGTCVGAGVDSAPQAESRMQITRKRIDMRFNRKPIRKILS